MNDQTRIITTAELETVSNKNEVRLELHDALHYLGKLEGTDCITVSIPIDGFNTQEVAISKDEEPALLEAIGAHIVKATEKIEGEIRALGVEPSDWTPPDEDESDDDGEE
jgi:hypothetical protein